MKINYDQQQPVPAKSRPEAKKVDFPQRSAADDGNNKIRSAQLTQAQAEAPASRPNKNPQRKKSSFGDSRRLSMRALAIILGVLIVLIAGAGIYYKSRLNLMKEPEEIFQGDPSWSPDELDVETGEPDPSAEEIEAALQSEMDAFLKDFSAEEVETDPVNGTDDGEGDAEATEKQLQVSGKPIGSKAGVKNYLVIGVDTAANNFRGRSDAMIVVSLNTNTKKVNLLSLYRGTAVDIPGRGIDNLNHSYAYGGPNLLKKTIEHNFRFKIDGYVVFNFRAFMKCINTLGGVNISLTDAEAKIVGLPGAGRYNLNGSQALSYARIRRIDSDSQRAARQRRVINAVLNKLRGSSASTINAFVNAILPNVGTNISHGEITRILSKAGTYLSYGRNELLAPSLSNRRKYYNKNGHEMWSYSVGPTVKQISDFLFN
ncbi:MAG: LCP family protein [Saccharofermentanales bacterium]|jgi:LCP family protein required for cell wall assembly|nr:LCP family protein [Bacillota bacterium]